jgi:hypothetical protein
MEKKKLREIWVKISKMHKTNDDDRQTFTSSSAMTFLAPETPILLNVGGQVFQTTVAVLTADKFSILAALCTSDPPLAKDSTGCFFIERDWWVFRYILQYLRNDTLPRDASLLEEMYTEASFYRLNSLRRAIEVRASTLTIKTKATLDVPSGGLLEPRGGWDDARRSLPDPFKFSR